MNLIINKTHLYNIIFADMMALPVELADESGEVVPVDTSTETTDEVVLEDEALTETTHANFLSLVRALFPARAAHRASKQQLHARCAAVMRSPIAPLNTWYNCRYSLYIIIPIKEISYADAFILFVTSEFGCLVDNLLCLVQY